MFKKAAIFLFISGTALSASAQDALTVLEQGGDLNVLYRNEASFGVLAHSSGGFGLNYRRGKHVTAKRKRILEFEAVNIRHPKEVKTVNPYFENSKGFYYGKMNSVFILRPGFGYQNTLFRKADVKSVEIRYIYMIGPSLAFAKPVYLEILHDTPQPFIFDLTTEKYNPGNPNHSFDNIYGRAPYFKGFEEMKVYPGLFAKFGLSFEFADLHDDLKVIETGITVDAYPKIIPIMASTTNSPVKNQQVYTSLYLSFIFGKKWF